MNHWPLVILLTLLASPGVCIAVPRVIHALVAQAPLALKKRLSKLAVIQTLLMTFVMAFSGAMLSPKTGLRAPVFEKILVGQGVGNDIMEHLFILFVISIATSVVFFFLYYQVVGRLVSQTSLELMKQLRKSIGLDGCVLYGGLSEEILTRWGLMNLVVFFGGLFLGGFENNVFVVGIILSSLIYAFGNLPTYFAAGCEKTQAFAFGVIGLNVFLGCVLGALFWQYGLFAAMFAHAVLHILWWYYD